MLLVACSQPAPPPPAPPLAKPVLPDAPFEQLDHDQRAEFMKQHVVPAMAPLFKNHAAKFADFGCKTCHGSDPKFTMPNPELPKLVFRDMSKFKREDIDWMKNEIRPTMAKLLARDNLRCENCHLSE